MIYEDGSTERDAEMCRVVQPTRLSSPFFDDGDVLWFDPTVAGSKWRFEEPEVPAKKPASEVVRETSVRLSELTTEQLKKLAGIKKNISRQRLISRISEQGGGGDLDGTQAPPSGERNDLEQGEGSLTGLTSLEDFPCNHCEARAFATHAALCGHQRYCKATSPEGPKKKAVTRKRGRPPKSVSMQARSASVAPAPCAKRAVASVNLEGVQKPKRSRTRVKSRHDPLPPNESAQDGDELLEEGTGSPSQTTNQQTSPTERGDGGKVSRGVRKEFQSTTKSPTVKGVSFDKVTKKWLVRRSEGGQQKYVGRYATLEEAETKAQSPVA